jgi:hypothetical protein
MHAFIALATHAVIITRRLLAESSYTQRWTND